MQKVDPNKKNAQKTWKRWAVIAGCVACFAAGAVAVPLAARSGLFRGQSSESAETAKFRQAYELLRDNWYYGKDDKDIDQRLIEQAITGMSSFDEDRHTNYFNLEQAQAFSQSLAGSNVGIGVSFYQNDDGHMAVRQVYINSTADRAGIQPGDEIIQIGDKETSSLSTDDLVNYIRSFEGKPLEIQLLRNGEQQTVSVTPGTFDSTVSARMQDGIGILTLSSFSADSGKDFTDAIGRLQKDGAKELILDLRNNTGGYLSAACQIASSFLPDDTVIFTENLRDGTQKKVTTDKSYAQISFDHIYILQNENTASASEVLIGALKDNLPDKVTTVGTSTYGKGTEQVTVPFEDGTSLKYTMAEWTTPSGTSINKTGFKPDVEIKADEAATVSYSLPAEGQTFSIAPDSVHPNAAAVQIYLRRLGYGADRSDAYFSATSSEALRQFQQDQGLDPTGTVDETTFNALIDAVGKKLNAESALNDAVLNAALALARGESPAEISSEEQVSETVDDGSGQVEETVDETVDVTEE